MFFSRVNKLCGTCGVAYKEWAKDEIGVPLYYIGNGDGTYGLGSPKKPNSADKYFCGPVCASKFMKEQQDEKTRQD